MDGVTIDRMGRPDTPAVARLDRENRGDDFLPSLGERFLVALYARFLDCGEAFGFAARDGGEIAAFIIGTEDSGRLFREVIRNHWLILGWRALPRLLLQPTLIGKTRQSFSYPGRGDHRVKAELLVMGTGREYRRRGLGRALISALDQEFSQRGVIDYQVTAKSRNPAANAFYRAEGFELRGTFQLYGEPWNLYLKQVGENGGDR